MRKKTRGIIIPPETRSWVKRLTQEQKWNLLDAIYTYNIDWEIVDMDTSVWIVFDMMRDFFDLQIELYEEKSIKNAENIKKRWDKQKIQNDTIVYDGIRTNTNYTNKEKINKININEVDENKENINKEVVEKHLETIDTGTNRYNFYILLLKNINLIKYTIDSEWLENIENKLLELRKKVWIDSVESEIQKFWEHHRTVKSKITSSISIRLDNWITKIK